MKLEFHASYSGSSDFSYTEEKMKDDKVDAKEAFETAVSQLSHLTTFQFMAQEDFKVNIKTEIIEEFY